MPLWGVSLDKATALRYGGANMRFLFELEGPFHGLAAWRESGMKEEEREIITGGRYIVHRTHERDGILYTTMREIEQVWPADP
jgi:hypothetical protein